MTLTRLKDHRCCGGRVGYYRHFSQSCQCEMTFSVFIPPQADRQPVPAVFYLSGLTCTEENFTTKAGGPQVAADLGLILIAPDTSPRGVEVPGADEDWDLGTGAGFYVDAIQEPWRSHYRMYSYITTELPELAIAQFPIIGDRLGICGHSMGGHGALVCGLRNPHRFRSISAFAPIVAPSQCPWGKKAFRHYLGENRDLWHTYDATALVQNHAQGDRPILIDQGTKDPFLEEQLMPEKFAAACEAAGQPLTLRMQKDYDHSYFFVASFLGDHLRHHGAILST